MDSINESDQNVDASLENEVSNLDRSLSSDSFEFGDFHENLAETSPEIPSDLCLPSIDYDDWSSIMSKVPEIVDTILGPEIPSPDSSPEDILSTDQDLSPSEHYPKHFSESGAALWEKYLEQQDLEPFSWETSHVRRMLFMSLEIPLNLDNTYPSHQKSKKDHISSLVKLSSALSLKDIALKDDSMEKEDSMPSEFDTQMARFLYLKSDEALSNLSLLLLKSHLLELEIILEKSNKYLEYWHKRKDDIENDKQMFEKVIESLTEHTKRQRTKHIKKNM